MIQKYKELNIFQQALYKFSRLQDLCLFRYADRVKELGVSDVSEEKSSPTEKEPDENGTNDEDYSRLTSYNVSLFRGLEVYPFLKTEFSCEAKN